MALMPGCGAGPLKAAANVLSEHPASSHLLLLLAASALQLLLAVAAAAIAVLLFAPALRFANGYWLQVCASK